MQLVKRCVIITMSKDKEQNKKGGSPTNKKNEPPPIKKERQAYYSTIGEKVQDYEKFNNRRKERKRN